MKSNRSKGGNGGKQQHIDSLIFSQSDEALTKALQLLPLNEIDQGSWETFLQSERVNDLVEPLLTINYNDVSDESTRRNCRNIKRGIQDLIRLLNSKNAMHSDDFFWKKLKSFAQFDGDGVPEEDEDFATVDDFSSSSLDPLRSLLILLVQSIFDAVPILALPATELFLLLCRLPHAVENFFSPNLFIGQRLVHPFYLNQVIVDQSLQTNNNKKKKMQKEQRQDRTEDEILSDDEEVEEVSKMRSSGYSHNDLESLLSIITSFVSSLSYGFLQLELARELISFFIDVVAQLVFRGTENTLRELGIKCITGFMCQLGSLRQAQRLESMMDEEAENYDEVHGRTRAPLVPLYPGGPSCDLLIWGCSTFMSHLVMSLSLGGKRIGTTVSSVPKHLLILRQIVILLICDLVKLIPALINPKELLVVTRMETIENEDAGMEDDEEATAGRGNQRRKKGRIVEDDDVEAILSDDDGDVQDDKKKTDVKKVKKGNTKMARMKKEAKNKADMSANDQILALIARSCLSVPDRKEWRELLARAIIEIIETTEIVEREYLQLSDINDLPSLIDKNELTAQDIQSIEILPLRCRLSYFITRLSLTGKTGYRMIALDVCQLLIESNRIPSYLVPCQLLSVIVRRIRDVQQGIRARALDCLASIINVTIQNSDFTESDRLKYQLIGSIYQIQINNHGPVIDLAKIISGTLSDDKQIVRKSALGFAISVATAITKLSIPESQLDQTLIQLGITDSNLLRSLCLDSSLQVKIKALTTVHTLLVLFPKSKTISRLWLDEALPAVIDPEKSVSEKLVDLVQTVVIDGLSESFGSKSNLKCLIDQIQYKNELMMPLNLLSNMTVENVEYLQRAVTLIYKKNSSFPSPFLQGLRQFLQIVCLESQLSSSVWPAVPFQILQEVITLQKNAIPPKLLCQCWEKVATDQSNKPLQSRFNNNELINNTLTVSRCIVTCLTAQAAIIATPDRHECGHRMRNLVESMTSPLGLITQLMIALKEFHTIDDKTSSAGGKLWLDELLTTVQNQLSSIVQNTAKEIVSCMTVTPEIISTSEFALHKNQSILCRCLFTLGDLAYTWNAVVPNYVITIVQALATDTLGGALGASASAHLRKNPTIEETPGINQSSRPVRLENRFSVSDVVKCQAILCLGKICLKNETLAKHLIETFVNRLNIKESLVVRNNVLVVFSDLCVRFTSLTDPYVPQFSQYLSDSTSALIRKQCLTLLAGLVAQDYIKCRGLIVFRLLTCLSDPHRSVRELAESVTLNIVLPRQANFIQNHFIEMLCFMNGWTGHPVFRPSAVGGASFVHKSPFCLLHDPYRRQLIYQFLFFQMNERDKHEVSRKLVHDFLAAFVDSDDVTNRTVVTLPKSPTEPGGSALRDALKLLGCKQMKISFGTDTKKQNKEETGEAEEEEEEGGKGKSDYELNLLKRNLAFQILPTLLSLKRMLEDLRSPFLRDMLQCLSGLLFDYKDELHEVLFHDPLLARQLETDFRRGLIHECDISDPSQQDNEQQEYKGRRGRPSLLLEPSPRMSAHIRSSTAMGDEALATGKWHRRRTLDPLNGHSTVLSLPRLRAEAVAVLSDKKQHTRSGSLDGASDGLPRIRSRLSVGISTIKSGDSPAESALQPEDKPECAVQLGRTEDERAEQVFVLTALRSARRRHSLPSACGPSQESTLTSVGKNDTQGTETKRESLNEAIDESDLEVDNRNRQRADGRTPSGNRSSSSINPRRKRKRHIDGSDEEEQEKAVSASVSEELTVVIDKDSSPAYTNKLMSKTRADKKQSGRPSDYSGLFEAGSSVRRSSNGRSDTRSVTRQMQASSKDQRDDATEKKQATANSRNRVADTRNTEQSSVIGSKIKRIRRTSMKRTRKQKEDEMVNQKEMDSENVKPTKKAGHGTKKRNVAK